MATIMQYSFSSQKRTKLKTNRHNLTILKYLIIILASTVYLQLCRTYTAEASFVDSSNLKPSIILITPQSFRVPTNPLQLDLPTDQYKYEQYVALINHAHNEREDNLLRSQYKKLALQIRDARAPITGQLFFEHVFDYFPQDSSNHMLIPIKLDQVSPVQERSSLNTKHTVTNYFNSNITNVPISDSTGATTTSRPTQLIVSVRPYQIDSGFASDHIELVSSAPIPVEPIPSIDGRRSLAVVQTDKPIYKPEDKVHIRALVVNENLRAVPKDELSIQIKNPHRLVVEEIKFPKRNYEAQYAKSSSQSNLEPLFLDHVFEFPPEPTLGTWSVHLLHNDPIANDTTSFEVREYTLPPFEIEFQSPNYVLPSTRNITGSIVAKYHYGKPVQGKAQFKFGYRESSTSKPRFVARSSIKNIDSITGRVDYRITTDKFNETGWFPSIAGSRFVVEVTVIEMATGHQETTQDSSCVFLKMPYKISFDDAIEDFKPGLTQQVSVQLMETQTQRPGPSGKRLVAEYRNQNNTLLVTNNKSSSGERFDTEAITDQTGRAVFKIGPLSEDISSVLVTIKLLNSTNSQQSTPPSRGQYDELAVGHHTLVKHESRNGWISLMNKNITYVNVGDRFVSDLLIRDAVVIPQKIYYLIVVKGQIALLNTLNSNGLVDFVVTEDMIPSFRLVLFALTHDSVGLLSDSMRVSVGQNLNCGLKLNYESFSKPSTNADGTYKPDDRGILKIQARTGDIVSLIGTDKAVYTLNNRTRLDSSRVLQRLKRLDTGCGFGGGRDNLDVFHNAGLTFNNEVASLDSSRARPIGSSCLTLANQLKYLEDVQLGYTRPAMSHLNHLRSLEVASVYRSRYSSDVHHSRSKRDVEMDSILKRYKDPNDKSCCRLGTMDDSPQRRNCSVRARIVEKYMRKDVLKRCSQIYFDCCRAIYGDQVSLSSMISPRDQSEPIVERKFVQKSQAPQYAEPHPLLNAGHLDRIESQTLVRKDFRETWLFDLVPIESSNGIATREIKLPHTITSWTVMAMSLNQYKPMCFMPKPISLTTFQKIFIQVAAPYKLIQGEQIDLLTTVFNYSPENQEVLVYIYGVENICSEAEPGERSEKKRIRLDKYGSQSILFPMIPLKTGVYPIKVAAIGLSTNSSDVVERQLRVVPRGKPVTDETTFSLDPMNHQRRSKRAIQTGNLVDEIDSSRGLQRSKVKLTPTRDSEHIVPHTQECIVSAIGDKMGQSVQTTMLDVENLIRLPHGCGEQVMIYLGPTLYTTRYLGSINKLSGDTRWRAARYIQSGYKRILNFRKESGSFSAFSRRDPSVWLTAFVAKLLCQTERTPFISGEVHVDKTVINSALNWLVDMQNNDTGTWTEKNPVYHREMLGGVLKENALTSFVIITLNECSHHSPDVVEEINLDTTDRDVDMSSYGEQTNSVDKLKLATQKAEEAMMLDRYKAVKERNPYVLALTAYALSFSRPHDAATMLIELMRFAERSHSRNQIHWRGDHQIETAAYALQTIIELAPLLSSKQFTSNLGDMNDWNPAADAIGIQNWLASRRSFTGAFDSTQDTVVALEALSKLAQLQSSPIGAGLLDQNPGYKPSLHCNVTFNNRTKRSIEFGKDNAQVLQTFKLDSLDLDSLHDEMLDIITSGNGLGTMSVKLKYNVFQEDDELCRFSIDSSVEEWKPKIIFSDQDQGKLVKDDDKEQDDRIDDDYFKTFDKSMLSELNLIDLHHNDVQNRELEQQNNDQQRPSTPPRAVLRMRRLTSEVDEVLSNLTEPKSSDSWTTKFMSTVRTKLIPSWLVPKETTSTVSFPKSASTASTTTATKRPSLADPLPDASRRTGTSRRSALASTIPIINQAPSFPAGVKLNTLSDRIELQAHNNTSGPNNTSIQHQQKVPSNRLVLLLRVCTHHISSRRDSEMSVIEIGVISGFKPNEADLKEIINDPGTPAMKYEISPDRSLVVIYMQYIPYTGPYCLQIRLIRESLVYNIQSGYIRVYEYYSPTHSCSSFYTPARVSDILDTRCDSSGQVCECASKSLCPSTNKIVELGEIHRVNSTSARNQLLELICSDKYDLISLVRLKNVRYNEAGKMYKLAIKAKTDLKGNLTKIIDLQRQQRSLAMNSVRKSQPILTSMTINNNDDVTSVGEDEDDTSLDYVNLSLDSSCVRNDPLLLHLGHPNQWKQGGELMILFGRSANLERKYHKIASKPNRLNSRISSSSQAMPLIMGPQPTPNSYGKITGGGGFNNVSQEIPTSIFEDAQQYQYSLAMTLDKNSMLHDITYQAKVGLRESINDLILWLELRARREKWTCPRKLPDVN